MASAEVSTGNASSTMTLVTSMFQVKIGIRNIVMPGARSMKIVVTRLTAPSTVAVLVTVTPTIHRSGPAPGAYVAPESGAYENHPKFAAPLAVRKPEIITSPPNRYIQYASALRRGNATSGAPIWSGTM